MVPETTTVQVPQQTMEPVQIQVPRMVPQEHTEDGSRDHNCPSATTDHGAGADPGAQDGPTRAHRGWFQRPQLSKCHNRPWSRCRSRCPGWSHKSTQRMVPETTTVQVPQQTMEPVQIQVPRMV